MLPTLVPNRQLAKAIRNIAVENNSLSLDGLADIISWASYHYAVETNVYPDRAACDAALSIASHFLPILGLPVERYTV